MRFQTVATLSGLAFLSMGFICGLGNGDDDDEGTDTEDPDRPDIPDGTDGDGGTDFVDNRPELNPTTVFFYGAFGWDSATGQVRETRSGSDVQQPTVVMELVNDNNEFCSFAFTQNTRLSEPTWVAEEGSYVYGGFTPALDSDMTVDTNCDEFAWSDDIYGGDDAFIERVSAFEIGLAVTEGGGQAEEAVEAAVIDQLGQSAWSNDWAPYIVGGGVSIIIPDDGTEEFLDLNYTFGFEVDRNFSVIFDDANGNGEMDDGEISERISGFDYGGGGLPTGAYSMRTVFGVGAEFLEL